MPCDFLFHTRCVNGHSRRWKCHDGPPATCERCDKDKKAAERAKAEQAKLLEQREAEKSELQQEMAQLDKQMASLKSQGKRARKDGTPTAIRG